VPKRLTLRRFHRGEKRKLSAKVHDRKLPRWVAQRYQLIRLIRNGLSVLAAARQVGCAKDTAYRCVAEFNHSGFRDFECSSNPDGRPSQISTAELEHIAQIAQKRPTDVGLPFTNWSISKLHTYLSRHRLLPAVSPEWLRQLLRREQVSWQRTKTWKKSNDPQFKAKKSAFWPSTPSGPNTGWSSAMTNSAHWNSDPSLACAGRAANIPSVTRRPTPARKVPNNCTPSMRCMPTAWSAGCANARPRTILRPALPNSAPATPSRCGSTSSWTTYPPIGGPRLISFPATTWRRSTCRPTPPGSTPSSRNSRLYTARHSRIPMILTISPVVGASTATYAGETGPTAPAARAWRDL
jgi:transposase